jgi:lipopolysaccharide export system ATP-binding protein
MLEIENITKSFKQRQVIHGISFHVEKGETVGILGRNGAGKTTSFRIAMGILKPDSGRVLLHGDDVTDLPMYKRARRGVGYLSQEPSIFRNMTVAENILAILETLKVPKSEREDRVREILGELDLVRLWHSKAKVLSGGERRRLEITRCLVTKPDFVLLDEPFSGVDPIAVSEIQEVVANLKNRNIGVLITDHNVRETLAITDRAYIVLDGSVLAHGSPEELVANPDVREGYLGADFKL